MAIIWYLRNLYIFSKEIMESVILEKKKFNIYFDILVNLGYLFSNYVKVVFWEFYWYIVK